MKILAIGKNNSTATFNLTINNDTGANYGRSVLELSGSYSPIGSDAGALAVQGSVGGGGAAFIEGELSRVTPTDWPLFSYRSGGTNAWSRFGVSWWRNTTTPINSFQFYPSTGNFAAGSSLVILGHD